MNLILWPVAFSTHQRMTSSKSTYNKPETDLCPTRPSQSEALARREQWNHTWRSFDFFSRSAANLWPSSATAQWHDQEVNGVRPGILHGKHIPVLGVARWFLWPLNGFSLTSCLRPVTIYSSFSLHRVASSQHEAFGSHKAFRRGVSEVWMYDMYDTTTFHLVRSTHDNLYMKKVYHIVSPLVKASLNRVFKMWHKYASITNLSLCPCKLRFLQKYLAARREVNSVPVSARVSCIIFSRSKSV